MFEPKFTQNLRKGVNVAQKLEGGGTSTLQHILVFVQGAHHLPNEDPYMEGPRDSLGMTPRAVAAKTKTT